MVFQDTSDNTVIINDIDIEEEISSLQIEFDKIAIDKIPFDKVDIGVMFLAASVEILLDFLLSDPANPSSFASKCNSSKNPIGKWCNNVHEKIDHGGNPLDFQGGFGGNGEFVKNGSRIKKDINFSGGEHRERTYGHDLLRFIHAIKQYHNGEFRDAAYVNGELIEVITKVNQNGKPYQALSWLDSIWAYICHMFADFFSSKSLPCPGWSFLSHASNRELRELAADLYKDGMNLRTESLKAFTVAVPDIILRIYSGLRYRDSEYSKEAIKQKRHLMNLITSSVATAVNIGKVIITENPVSINLPMMARTIKLAWSCVKDQIDYNNRVIAKVNYDVLITKYSEVKTMVVVAKCIYITNDYHQICNKILIEEEAALRKQELDAAYLHLLNEYYSDKKSSYQDKRCLATSAITIFTESVPISLNEEDTLSSVSNTFFISNKEIENDNIKQYL